MKRILSVLILTLVTVGFLTAATPTTSIRLVQKLPASMNIGEEATVTVQISSDQQFISATALPSFEYAGKGVVAIQGGDRIGRGTSALLNITFKAKNSTARMTNGVAPVYVVVGVRYAGGYVVSEQFRFDVRVP